MLITLLLILGFLLLLAILCTAGGMIVFYLPYAVWRAGQNEKGLNLHLADVSQKEDFANARRWWKSIFTRKPAF